MRTPTHYEEGKRVAFMKTGLRMAGLIFLPPNMEPGRRYPAVVVAHPGGGVKEQVPSLYCWNLAQKGYVALAFDASHQGESEGEPRYLEDPYSRVEDIRAAVDYLTTLEYVDRSRIGAMGVCAGAGYTMSAAINDARIKAAAGVCTWNTGTWIRDGFPYKGRCAMLGQALAAAADARTREANGEGPVYTHFVPESPADFTDETPQIMKDASDYYKTDRCSFPTSKNLMLVQSLDRLATYDAFAFIETVSPRPLLFIVGSLADTRHFTEDAYERAAQPKELCVIEDARHVDLYDDPKYVGQALEKIAAFFDRSL